MACAATHIHRNIPLHITLGVIMLNTNKIPSPAPSTIDFDDMIDNPLKYGYGWRYGKLHHEPDGDTTRVLLTDRAPFMSFVDGNDIDAVRRTFGDAFVLANMDGTSAKVIQQRARADILKDRSLIGNDRALKRKCIERDFGIITRSGPAPRVIETIRDRFCAIDGTPFETQLEATEYSKLLLSAAE